MIQSLRRKFILVAMVSTFAVLSLILGLILALSYRNIVSRADSVLAMLGENSGRFPEDLFGPAGKEPGFPFTDGREEERRQGGEPGGRRNFFTAETPYETRFFSVLLDPDGESLESDLSSIASVTESEAVADAAGIFLSGKTKGFLDSLRYQMFSEGENTRVVFVDCSASLRSFRQTLLVSFLVSVSGLILVFLLVVVFSRIVFRPVEESYRKQKQFITDASHELKTPLAIIDANTEVLEMTSGESEWTASIRRQTGRLTSLVQQMVTLTRMDEGSYQKNVTWFSLSDAVQETAELFVVPAEVGGKELEISTEPGLKIRGDENAVRQLVSLLLDNAVKYSSDGTIRLSLSRHGKKNILAVVNPAEDMETGNQDILFERFYRRDTSRSKETGGSGIGLSVAKAIVELHGGSIHARSRDGMSLEIEAVLVGIPGTGKNAS